MVIPKKGTVPGRIPYAWKGTAGEWEAFVKGADGGLAVSSVENIIRIDKVDSSITYVGYALPGTSETDEDWQIIKITKSNNMTSVLYADGITAFTKKWDERENYTYS